MKQLKLLSILSLCVLGGCVEENIMVVDAAGAPIENVQIYSDSMSMASTPALTNAKGEAKISSNIQGVKWLRIEKDGFQSIQIAVPETWPIQIILEQE